MSKYDKLWNWIKENSDGKTSFKFSFYEIEQIAGVPVDHSFLTYKKELLEYGWAVKKIYMKDKLIEFEKSKG